jgi:hypothetical protein
MIIRFANFFIRPAIILFFLLGVWSCSKKVTAVTTTPSPATVDVQEINFGYMHGKARMVYKDDKKEREVKAHVRIRKDSVIWMTFTVVGVQGGKALINKDSITIVSTMDREYYVFDYAELTKRFHFTVNYQVIESAILGNLLQQKKGNDIITSSGNYDILAQAQGDVLIKNSINRTSKKIEKVELVEPASGNTLNISYSDFQPLGDRSFPYNGVISVMYKSLNGMINNTINVEFNKAEVGDKELKFPFNIPRKYDRR